MAMRKTKIKKDLQYYLNLPWTYTIETTYETGEKLYVIHVNELHYLGTDAPTLEQAMASMQEIMTAVFEAAIKEGQELPEPIDQGAYKGNVAYRTTPGRHYYIVREARRRNLSLSQLIDTFVDLGARNINHR
jgi:antitoxin HicB